MGMTWDSRLALWLPGPPIIGAVIIVGCLIATHLIFVWFFGLQAHTITFILSLLIAYILMIPRYLNSRNLLDRQLYGLKTSLAVNIALMFPIPRIFAPVEW